MEDTDDIWGLGENSLIKIEEIILDILNVSAKEEQVQEDEKEENKL